MDGLDGLVAFGGDAPADEGSAEAPEAQPQAGGEAQPEAREQHSRTRAHDEKGRFAGPAPEQKPEPAPAAPQRLKFKVPKEDGSGDEDLELTPEEASQRLAEARKLAKARDEEKQTREQEKREAQALKQMREGLKRKEDRGRLFRSFMRESGLSADEAEEALADALLEEVQEQSLSPQEKRLRELEEREAQRLQEEQHRQAEARVAKFTADARAKEAEYAKVWGEALEKTGLPPTPELLADIAREHLLNKKRGLSLTPAELADYASRKFDASLDARLKGVSAEAFAKRFPEAAQAWAKRTDDMDPDAFLKAHPEMGKKLLRHFRAQAQAKGRPGVGVTRPAARPAAPQQQDNDAPRFYNPWDVGH